MPELKYSLGWVKQQPDERDLQLVSVSLKSVKNLPKEIDLRKTGYLPEVYDQGEIGSCGPNAAAAAAQYLVNRDGYKWPFQPSRLFLYYNARKVMGSEYVHLDSGVTLRELLKAFNEYGCVPEAEPQNPDKENPGWWWEYGNGVAKFRSEPPAECYKQAKLHKALRYEAVPLTEQAIKSTLADGTPVIFGIMLYEQAMSKKAARTGEIPIPKRREELLGGHAMLFVGYTKSHFIIRNSWGTGWGEGGYGKIPIDYAVNPEHGSDYWALFNTGYKADA